MAGKRLLRYACCATALRFALGFALGFAPGSLVRADEPTRETILVWIAELGDGEFAVRDRATGHLNQLTLEHLPFLLEQLESATDPEVIVRLSGVVARLKHERQQKIIRAFLRDPDMNQTHELEGWKSFAAVAGANRSSKRLFLKLYDRYPELVEKPLGNGQEAFDAAASVSRVIQQTMVQLGEGDSTDGLALLYCLCAMNSHGDQRLASAGLRVFRQFPYNRILMDPQSKRPIETLMERWALSLQFGNEMFEAMRIMVETDLGTVRSVAQKVLKDRAQGNRAEYDDILLALQMMFRFGKEEDLPLIEAWLDCTEVCIEIAQLGNRGVPGGLGRPPLPDSDSPSRDMEIKTLTLEVRDAAILACMRITGMDYRSHFPRIRTVEMIGYQPNTVLSPAGENELREARIAAWRGTRKP